MAKHIIIDGTEYPVAITQLKRRADILDKYAYRSEDGHLHREVIGTYHNYDMQIACYDRTVYNALFDVLSEPTASHKVIFPHDQVQFDAYFSSVQDEILLVDQYGGKYKGLSCKCTAMIPRRTPSRNATS